MTESANYDEARRRFIEQVAMRPGPRTGRGEMDDPREVLEAAGVECAEVDQYAAHPLWVRTPHGELAIDKDQADAAILALARLVAKYRWIAERHESVVDRVLMERPLQFDALEARWELEHDA